jgi:beta-lactamase class A
MLPRFIFCALLALPSAIACGSGGESAPESTLPVLVGEPVGTTSPPRDGDSAHEQGTEDEVVSLGWLAGGASFPAVPSPFAPTHESGGLRAAVESALDGRDGRFSVIVRNLADGREVSINAGETYYAASLFKAAVLLTAYQLRDAGTLDFTKEVEITEESAENDLGTLEYLELEVGDKVTIGDAVKAMVVVSDTTLANLVLEEIGYAPVDAVLESVGAIVMTVSDRELPTTAEDMAALISAIATGNGASEASRQEMLSLMAQEWFGEGVVAGLPTGTVYAHKTGSFTDATHDVAIVEGPAGPYLIAVLSDGSGEWEPIAAVSAAVWHYFEVNP